MTKTKTYDIDAIWPVRISVSVEASSLAEARAIAAERLEDFNGLKPDLAEMHGDWSTDIEDDAALAGVQEFDDGWQDADDDADEE